jgi:hypothetical protein
MLFNRSSTSSFWFVLVDKGALTEIPARFNAFKVELEILKSEVTSTVFPFARFFHRRNVPDDDILRSTETRPVRPVIRFEIVDGILECFFVSSVREDDLVDYSTLSIKDIKMRKIVCGIIAANFLRAIIRIKQTDENRRKPQHLSSP